MPVNDYMTMVGDLGLVILVLLTAGTAVSYTAFQRAHRLLHDGRVENALTAYGAFHKMSRVVTQWRGPSAACIGYCYLLAGDPYEAIRRLDEAMAEPGKPLRGEWPPLMQTYKAMALSALGDYRGAESLFLEVEQSRGLKARVRQTVIAQRAANLVGMGRYAEAELAFNEILKGELEPNLRAWSQAVLAVSRMYRGNLTDARATVIEALNHLQGLKPHTQVRVLSGATPVLLACGETDRVRSLEPQITVYMKSENMVTRSLALAALAEIALSRSEFDRARCLAEESITGISFAGVMARALLVQAEVFKALKNNHRASALCQNVIESNASAYHVARARMMLEEMQRPSISVAQQDQFLDVTQRLLRSDG